MDERVRANRVIFICTAVECLTFLPVAVPSFLMRNRAAGLTPVLSSWRVRKPSPKFRNCADWPIVVPAGFLSGYVHRVPEWACLTEGRHRCALSRSNTRNSRARFLPLPSALLPAFLAGQESLNLAVLHFVAAQGCVLTASGL